jgi:hypothetical protein
MGRAKNIDCGPRNRPKSPSALLRRRVGDARLELHDERAAWGIYDLIKAMVRPRWDGPPPPPGRACIRAARKPLIRLRQPEVDHQLIDRRLDVDVPLSVIRNEYADQTEPCRIMVTQEKVEPQVAACAIAALPRLPKGVVRMGLARRLRQTEPGHERGSSPRRIRMRRRGARVLENDEIVPGRVRADRRGRAERGQTCGKSRDQCPQTPHALTGQKNVRSLAFYRQQAVLAKSSARRGLTCEHRAGRRTRGDRPDPVVGSAGATLAKSPPLPPCRGGRSRCGAASDRLAWPPDRSLVGWRLPPPTWGKQC